LNILFNIHNVVFSVRLIYKRAMSAPLLDNATLSCLFHPRYMGFELCVRLEPVSTIFHENARRYYRQLESFDFHDYSSKENGVKWASKVYHCCPNLREIRNLEVNKKDLDDYAINCHFLTKIPSVTHVGLDFQHFSESALLTLSDMKNLDSLEIVSEPYHKKRVVGNNRFRKLDVTSLKCDQLNLVSFCNSNSLTTLHLSVKDVIFGELIQALKGCRHLQVFSIEWTEPGADDVLQLINFVAEHSRIETFSLSIESSWVAEQLANLAKHAGFQKCLRDLSLGGFTYDKLQSLVSIFTKLPELRALRLAGSKGLRPRRLFQQLPNLECIEAVSYFYVNLTKGFPARFHVETTYVRYI